MLDLISDLKEYASDDEEENHITLIKQSISKLNDKVDEVNKQCESTELQLELVMNSVNDSRDSMNDPSVIKRVLRLL
jgi:uncharacterized coiled-coil protein SlyX